MQYGLSEEELNKLTILFDKYPTIERVILYGSRAKGTFRIGSDIDITLIGDKVDKSTLNNLEIEIDDLLLAYKFDISIFHQLSNIELIEHIYRVGKVIYLANHNKK